MTDVKEIYPKKNRNDRDFSDYERLKRAADDAFECGGILVLEGIYEVHRPLVFSARWAPEIRDRFRCRRIRGASSLAKDNNFAAMSKQLEDKYFEDDPSATSNLLGHCVIKAVQYMEDDVPSEYLWNPIADAVLIAGQADSAGAFFDIEKTQIDAAGLAAYAALFQYTSDAQVRDMKFKHGCRGGVVFEACQVSHIENVHCKENQGFGALFISANGAKVFGLTATGNGGDGVIITALDTDHAYETKWRQEKEKSDVLAEYLDTESKGTYFTYTPESQDQVYPAQGMLNGKSTIQNYDDSGADNGSGGVFIYNLNAERNGTSPDIDEDKGMFNNPSPQMGHGIVLVGTGGATSIIGGWIEGNIGDAIHIHNSSSTRVSNLKIYGKLSKDVSEAQDYSCLVPSWLRIQGNSSGNLIENCYIEPGFVHDGTYSYFYEERDGAGNLISNVPIEREDAIKLEGGDWVLSSDNTKHVKRTANYLLGADSNPLESLYGEQAIYLDLWTYVESPKFFGHGHFCVRIEKETGERPMPGDKIVFRNNGFLLPQGGFPDVATAEHFLSLVDDCLQFADLKTSFFGPPDASGDPINNQIEVGRPLDGSDPLRGFTPYAQYPLVEAIYVENEAQTWRAELVQRAGRLLQQESQLHKNYIKDNFRHYPTGSDRKNIRPLMRMTKEIDAKILAESVMKLKK